MAAPKKSRRLSRREANGEENSSDSDDGIQNETEEEMETINVDFDVSFPEITDKHGIKNLLQQLFLKAHINISELADLLIEQVNITGVIKQSQDDDEMEVDDDMDVTFGIFSVINLSAKKNMQCVQQICSYLLDHCQKVSSNEQYENFKKIIEDHTNHVGLVISERFINIPAKIAVPLYASLGNDMKSANEKQQPFDFKYYILISKVLTFNGDPDVYVNPEEELIAEVAEFSFEFPVETEQDSGGWTDDDAEGIPKRRVLLLPSSKWDIMYSKIEAELGS